MARVFKCDRCGSVYDPYVPRSGGFTEVQCFGPAQILGAVLMVGRVDLCPLCAASLEVFLAGGDADAES